MKKTIYCLLGIIMMAFMSCGQEETSSSDIDYLSKNHCNSNRIKTVYIAKENIHSQSVFSHIILIENYKNECYNSIDFYSITRAYVDSCKKGIPIETVYFVSSANEVNFAEFHSNKVREKILLGYSIDTKSDSVRIKSLKIVNNGQIKTIEINEGNFKEN